jgi:hypothetical protein
MEASEKPQLPLDPEGAVRALDDRLVIERLEVQDERAAQLVRERQGAGYDPAETVADAIEIGARVLDREDAAAEVDYVRAEFEKQAGALRERLGKALEEGDRQLAERIATSFDGAREGSVQRQVSELLTRALAEQRTSLVQLFSSEDGANPLTDFKGAVVRALKQSDERHAAEGRESRERMEQLARELVELKERDQADRRVAEAEEAGTRKGRSFEQGVFSMLERIADTRGDAAAHVGDERGAGGGKKGDVVAEVGAAEGNPLARIVFEVKDERLSKQAAWKELDGAMEERDASFAVLVVAGADRIPAGREELHEYEGNKLIIAVDAEEPGERALEVAYRYARCRVLLARDRELRLDAAAVRDATHEAESALKEAQRIRLALTGAEKNVSTAREGLDLMVGTVLDRLTAIEGLVSDEPAG